MMMKLKFLEQKILVITNHLQLLEIISLHIQVGNIYCILLFLHEIIF